MTRNGTISTISPVMRRIMAALDRDGDMDDGYNQAPPAPRFSAVAVDRKVRLVVSAEMA